MTTIYKRICSFAQLSCSRLSNPKKAIKPMKKTILLTALVLSGLTSFAQSNDEKNIKLFYKKALTESKS